MPRKRKAASTAKKEDWNSLTVAKLKTECTKRGLETNGKKIDLVDRIEEYENEQDAGPPVKIKKQSTIQKALTEMKKSAKSESNKKQSHSVDKHCTVFGGQVHGDYDCMLNQTNIGNNNNKYYVIQVIKAGNQYYAWNRWGRVGEPGQKKLNGPFLDSDDAIKEFKKKYSDKTRNQWENRSKFKAVPGKYTLLEMGEEEEEEQPQSLFGGAIAKVGKALTNLTTKTKPCTLDQATQALVKLIFDNDMFKEALIKMEIDVKKLPLGKLSKSQIVKGFEVLDDISVCLKSGKTSKLTELSNQFYTVVPQAFGRQRPPVINDEDHLRKKLDMLITLGDIEMAQQMLKKKEDTSKKKQSQLEPHPLDDKYELLQCDLTSVKVNDKEFQIIEKYLKSTGGYRAKKIVHIWRMDRKTEKDRFKQHATVGNRKLLWHGTNVAVVAAICKSGLRIMPQSGGRVGRGIYFASENSKSAGYVGTSGKTGIMFLTEVALGKEHSILKDDSSLTKAPTGSDCVIARGTTEPDPKHDTSITLEGKKVAVPQGKPIPQNKYKGSYFSQSEYLVYKESQVRMRYMLQLEFDW